MLKHNGLSFEDLITCERTMLKFVEGKLSNTGMNFKVWDWSIPELYGIVLGMFTKLDLSGTLDITTSEMLDFIIDVDQGYLETAYHSFLHAVDVVAVLYYMLTDLGAGKHLSSMDCIVLLIAGLCHDVGHPGLNNLYQINARTELAKRYNDQSVLENHSCALTAKFLTKHKLLRNVHKCSEYMGMNPKEVDSHLRSMIQKTILATDMAFHFDLLEQFNNIMESTWSSCSSENSGDETDQSFPTSPASSVSSSLESCSPISFSPPRQAFGYNVDSSPRSSIVITLDAEQRQLWLNVLIHAADLSNTVRPWEIAKKWSDLVVEEFFLQGDLEKKNKLPVSPNMDREQAHQCQISLGFGDLVVKPYFERFALFLYPAKIFLEMLADNREAWEGVKNAPKPKPQSEPTPTVLNEKPLTYHQRSPSNGRRVSLAAGFLIIPDDIQEKLRNMTSPRSPRYRKLKRSLSGRSYSHHSILQQTHSVLTSADESHRKSTRRKSTGPPSLSDKVTAIFKKLASKSTTPKPQIPTLTPKTAAAAPQTNNKKSSGNNYQRRYRIRRSSSLDQDTIRQLTAEQPTEHLAVIAGS